MSETINPEVVNVPDDVAMQASDDAGSDDVAVQNVADDGAAQQEVSHETTPWNWAENMPGDGERPEFLKEKYKSVADQAKAYLELEKRMGEFKGAPKDGYQLDKLPEGIDKDDPLVKGFADIFQKMNLSQEGFEAVTKQYMDLAGTMSAPSSEELMSSLGPNGKEILGRVNNWLDGFSAEDKETIKGWALTPKDIQALDAIRAGRSSSRLPTPMEAMPSRSYESSKAVEAEKNKNWSRYNNDEAYRNEVMRRWTDALKREGKN